MRHLSNALVIYHETTLRPHRLKCPVCHKMFPVIYDPKQKRVKEYGTKQLMSIFAWSNAERHVRACRRKEED